METLANLAAIPGPVFLAIGVFDGVHPGHRAVISRALADARAGGGNAAVVTFDPHPAKILRPEKAPRLLTSTAHKLRIIRSLGAEHILALPFTREFAATEPADFIRAIAAACELREICVGHEWAFGKDRAGNLALLDQLGGELGFDEVGVPAVEIDGEVVSSTALRAAIENGDLARAARLLGREYSILGTVQRGEQLGRKLGFPTANLAAHNEQFPPNGVYAVDVLIDDARLRGVANIGVRPTIAHATGERLLEVHVLDFAREIYGADLEVVFRRFIRAEQKFPSLDALRAQIAADATEAHRD
ncbi:MAG: bifunctional riboflavin kinase/FAD synthetase [Chthoniobacteraceae bacterium]